MLLPGGAPCASQMPPAGSLQTQWGCVALHHENREASSIHAAVSILHRVQNMVLQAQALAALLGPQACLVAAPVPTDACQAITDDCVGLLVGPGQRGLVRLVLHIPGLCLHTAAGAGQAGGRAGGTTSARQGCCRYMVAPLPTARGQPLLQSPLAPGCLRRPAAGAIAPPSCKPAGSRRTPVWRC